MLLRIVKHPDRDQWADLVRRPALDLGAAMDAARPVMDAVRDEGDPAIRRFTAQFDGVDIDQIRVATSPVPAIPNTLQEAILAAIHNIERFHAAQREPSRRVETTPGVVCWRSSLPIERVGLYVPGGSAPLLSSVLMLGVPARLAGCREIVLCTPPRPDGTLDPSILFAAAELNLPYVYRVGGAQAIAAMTFGTATVPRVDKLFGPGNQYVAAAKQLAGLVGTAVDLPAGPTELAVVADSSADPRFVAADLLAQAEHGPDSHVLLISTDRALPPAVERELARQLDGLPRADIARAALKGSLCVVVADVDEAMDLANAYAAEHLILATTDADRLASRVEHAGSVFVGTLATESIGDYASGTNHTLPTAGAARAFSGVSLDSFVRKVTFQTVTEDGLRRIGPTVMTLAEAEHLAGHARAVAVRLDAIGRALTDPHRVAEVHRATRETEILVRIDLDGSGLGAIETGLGFFDHMLDQVARHGGIDLTVRVRGDLQVDEHHTVEDTAIALGEALRKALGDKRGIERYGFVVPMDDALAQVALDLSGRAWLVWDVEFVRDRVGDVPTELWHHFFKSFSDAAACNLNIRADADNDHHRIESIFKAFARTIRMAVRRSGSDQVPSTKGAL